MAKKSEAQWLIDLLKHVEGHIEESTLTRILEKRGRSCIGTTYINKARNAAKDTKNTDEFLENLAKVFPYLKREGEKAYVVFPKCFCHHLKGFKGDVPHSYCYCSVGWVKEMFEQALDKPVEVNIESSVLRGGKNCRLRVLL